MERTKTVENGDKMIDIYVPNEADFPTPQWNKRTGNPPDGRLTNSAFLILAGFHGEEFLGYPATSSAQLLGISLEIPKHSGAIVYRIFVRCGMEQRGDILRTVCGNATKHHRSKKYPLPPFRFAPSALHYFRKVYKVVLAELEAECSAAAAEAKKEIAS